MGVQNHVTIVPQKTIRPFSSNSRSTFVQHYSQFWIRSPLQMLQHQPPGGSAEANA